MNEKLESRATDKFMLLFEDQYSDEYDMSLFFVDEIEEDDDEIIVHFNNEDYDCPLSITMYQEELDMSDEEWKGMVKYAIYNKIHRRSSIDDLEDKINQFLREN